MPIFSERYNLIEKTKLQKGSLEQGTRNLLWNEIWELKSSLLGNNFFDYAELIWCQYLKKCSDEFPYNYLVGNNYPDYTFLKDIIVSGEWHQVFDVLELTSIYGKQAFKDKCNRIFERENCAYRFIGNYITEITSDVEIQEVEEAANTNVKNVDKHIKQSLKHFSDRKSPDYRNSIKESISAVEALCRNITGESTLDKALKNLEAKGVVFNSELKKGLEKIYVYTNGEDGIRHAIMDNTNITKADAKFMLVICCAFINYIRENINT